MNIETQEESKEPENAAEVMARAVEFAKKRTECLVLGGGEEAALDAQLALLWDEFKDTSWQKILFDFSLSQLRMMRPINSDFACIRHICWGNFLLSNSKGLENDS